MNFDNPIYSPPTVDSLDVQVLSTVTFTVGETIKGAFTGRRGVIVRLYTNGTADVVMQGSYIVVNYTLTGDNKIQ